MDSSKTTDRMRECARSLRADGDGLTATFIERAADELDHAREQVRQAVAAINEDARDLAAMTRERDAAIASSVEASEEWVTQTLKLEAERDEARQERDAAHARAEAAEREVEALRERCTDAEYEASEALQAAHDLVVKLDGVECDRIALDRLLASATAINLPGGRNLVRMMDDRWRLYSGGEFVTYPTLPAALRAAGLHDAADAVARAQEASRG